MPTRHITDYFRELCIVLWSSKPHITISYIFQPILGLKRCVNLTVHQTKQKAHAYTTVRCYLVLTGRLNLVTTNKIQNKPTNTPDITRRTTANDTFDRVGEIWNVANRRHKKHVLAARVRRDRR